MLALGQARHPDLAAAHDFHLRTGEMVVKNGEFRDDVACVAFASYCLHVVTATDRLSSKAEVRRLVTVTLYGLPPARRLIRRTQAGVVSVAAKDALS